MLKLERTLGCTLCFRASPWDPAEAHLKLRSHSCFASPLSPPYTLAFTLYLLSADSTPWINHICLRHNYAPDIPQKYVEHVQAITAVSAATLSPVRRHGTEPAVGALVMTSTPSQQNYGRHLACVFSPTVHDLLWSLGSVIMPVFVDEESLVRRGYSICSWSHSL